jgi:hypothetical protein
MDEREFVMKTSTIINETIGFLAVSQNCIE